MSRRFLSCLFLAVCSAWVAEILLGDLWLQGVPPVGQQVFELVLFSVFYGSGAILIREIVRRTGRGWPTVLCLALVHGLLEEGLFDQTLYNPHYLGLNLLSYGHIGWIGTAGPWAIYVLSLHVVWSITVPIIVIQHLTLTHDDPASARPWIRSGALLVIPAVLYVLGATVVYLVSVPASGFHLSARQLVATLVAVAVVLVVAFGVFRRRPAEVNNQIRPRSTGVVTASVAIALVLSSLSAVLSRASGTLPAWITVVLMMACIVAAIALTVRFRLDPFGLAVGALITYAWVGLGSATGAGATGMIEQSVIVIITAVVVAVAWRHSRRVSHDRSVNWVRADSVG